MHELSITQSVVEICEQHAQGRRVLSVILEIGSLSGVVPDAVEFCFEACTRATPLEGARLEIVRLQGKGRCLDCGAVSEIGSYFDPCTSCGGFRLEIIQGEELRVKELDVE